VVCGECRRASRRGRAAVAAGAVDGAVGPAGAQGADVRPSPDRRPTATAARTTAPSGAFASTSSARLTASRPASSSPPPPTRPSASPPPSCSSARSCPARTAFEELVRSLGGRLLHPDRSDAPHRFGSLGGVRKWIESGFATCKGQPPSSATADAPSRLVSRIARNCSPSPPPLHNRNSADRVQPHRPRLQKPSSVPGGSP
jgi:hypothetical protein